MAFGSSLSALEYALHDLELEDSGKTLTFFWDTSLVRNALLGRAFYYDVDAGGPRPTSAFVDLRFRSDNTLVYSLASAGWYGRLRLLQSHQAELVKLINRGLNIGLLDVPFGGVSEFLKDVSLIGIDPKEIDQLENLPKKRIESLVRMQAGEAPRLFKVVQGIRHRSWKERLSAWLKEELFCPETAPYKYHEILKTRLFEDLYAAFEKQRSGKDENNLSDAIAMCQLHEKMQEFRSKQSEQCPLFVGSALYHRVLSQTKLIDHFTYDFNNQQFSALRSEEYFIIRASVAKPTVLSASPNKSKQAERFSELRQELQDMSRDSPPKQLAALHRLAAKSQKVADLVTRVKHYSFLEDVWLPYAAAEDLIDAIYTHMVSSKALAESTAFQEEIDGQVATFLSEIRGVSHEFEKIRKLSKELHTAASQKRDRFEVQRPEASFAVLSGLFRFGFAKTIQANVDDVYRDVVSEDGATRSRAILNLIKMAPFGEEPVKEDIALVAAGVLWALGMYRQVKDILEHVRSPTLLPTRVLLSAAGLRLNEISNCLTAVRELEDQISHHPENVVTWATALAYLTFNLRKCYLNSNTRRSAKELQDYLSKAVLFAQMAKENAQDLDQRVYASNQKLYYMISDGESFSRDEIMDLAEELLESEGNVEVWQYRYDDTLAMYYEWLSTSSTDKRRWLDLALRKAESAMKGCGGEDADVERHLERILRARERAKK